LTYQKSNATTRTVAKSSSSADGDIKVSIHPAPHSTTLTSKATSSTINTSSNSDPCKSITLANSNFKSAARNYTYSGKAPHIC
ncbi:hypothetical protein NPIL_464931, partial [Nephila pilipes]